MADVLGLLSRVGQGIKGSQLLNDPYLLSILAGSMAQAVDEPEAWSAKLGGTAAGLARGMKFGEAATKEREERKEYLDTILRLLGGGFTAPDQPGLTSAKFGPGKISVEATTPSEWSPEFNIGETPPATAPVTTRRPGVPLDFSKILGEYGNF